jgi:hypothetical protein
MTKKIDVDAGTAAKAAELVAMLSDRGAYEKWLAAMRGIIASADSKLAAAAAEAKSKNAEKLLRDATAMLAKQTEREQALADKEANLRERESALALATKTADDDHARQQTDLNARARLLDARAEHLDGARKLLREGLQRLRDEWVALRKVGEDIEALQTVH